MASDPSKNDIAIDDLIREIDEWIKWNRWFERSYMTAFFIATVGAIVLNMYATISPVCEEPPIYSKLATGLATALIAIDGALLFGPGWQNKKMRRADFENVKTGLSLARSLDDENEKKKRIDGWAKQFYRVRQLAASLPGVSAELAPSTEDRTKP